MSAIISLMSLETEGYCIVPRALTESACDALIAALEPEAEEEAALSQRGGAVFARRNLAAHPAVVTLANSAEVALLLPERLRLVRAILFDKLPGANWPVPWHQDLSIIVRERVELEGWGPWSTKAGHLHVQPPAEFLERLLALRVHLDDCPEANGALRVLPGTHKLGRIAAERVAELRAEIPERVCPAHKGDVLLIRPLLLHASSPASEPTHRRVLHLEFAPEDLLPPELSW